MTAVVWDERRVFDGALYIADEGTNADSDSRLYRLSASGELTVFASAPAPAFDDIFAMAFAPDQTGWPRGLLVAGDTDGTGMPQWGLVTADGQVATFSMGLSGVTGIAVDSQLRYGSPVLASRAASAGFAGDDSITRIRGDGSSGGTIARELAGVIAITVAPPGPFRGLVWASSWVTHSIFAVEFDGGTSSLASGLAGNSNDDANLLAFSPDGRVLMVAESSTNRIVCIEPE